MPRCTTPLTSHLQLATDGNRLLKGFICGSERPRVLGLDMALPPCLQLRSWPLLLRGNTVRLHRTSCATPISFARTPAKRIAADGCHPSIEAEARRLDSFFRICIRRIFAIGNQASHLMSLWYKASKPSNPMPCNVQILVAAPSRFSTVAWAAAA